MLPTCSYRVRFIVVVLSVSDLVRDSSFLGCSIECLYAINYVNIKSYIV